MCDTPFEILRKVNNGELMFGFVPTNTVHYAIDGKLDDKHRKLTNISFVGKMYDYPLNLITTFDNVTDFGELKNKSNTSNEKISIGMLNRKDYFLSLEELVKFYEMKNIEIIQYDTIDALIKAYGVEIKMVFHPASHPNKCINDLFNKTTSKFMSLNDMSNYHEEMNDIKENFYKTHKYLKTVLLNMDKMKIFYRQIHVPSNVNHIRVLSNEMMLVCNPTVDTIFVENLLNIILENLHELNKLPFIDSMNSYSISTNNINNLNNVKFRNVI